MMFEYLAQFELSHPLRLIALLVVPVILYMGWKKMSKFGRFATICRAMMATLLILAWSGIVHRGPTETKHVSFVVDSSASIDVHRMTHTQAFVMGTSLMKNRPGHHGRTWSFAKEHGPWRIGAQPDANSLGTNPSPAVLYAAATSPPDRVPEIILLTDGNETQGDLLRTAFAANVPISVVPLWLSESAEISIATVRAASHATAGEQLAIDVVMDSNHDDRATIELYRDSELVASREIEVPAGRTVANLTATMSSRRRAVFEARLVNVKDEQPANNRRSAVVFRRDKGRVLTIGPSPLAKLLQEAGFEVTTKNPRDLPAASGELDVFDLIVMSDVSSSQFNATHLEAIDSYVRAGGGLLAIGGERTYGESVYRATAVEQMLPVKAATKIEAEKLTLAMVLIIDKSLSMEKQRRMELAKEAAKETVKLLAPEDKVGVLAFGDDSQWASPIVPCRDKPEIIRQIDRLQPLGVTNMFPAMQRAYLALEQTEADKRHVILLTDGVPSPGDFSSVAANMAAAGITVSTVSVGKDADQTILKDISMIAQGKHYPCDDPSDVTSILVKETRSATDAVRGREFRPYVLRSLPGLDVSEAPALNEYATCSPKSGAEVLLVAAGGDPLLSWWRYGAGVAVAFTSGAESFADRWRTWPRQAEFWSRLANHAQRKSDPANGDLQIRRSKGQATVTLNAVKEDAEYLNGAKVAMMVSGPGMGEAKIELPQVAPGRYESSFAATALGVYEVKVAWIDEQGKRVEQSRGFAVDYEDEFRLLPTNEALLQNVAEVSNGRYNLQTANVFDLDGRQAMRVTQFWRYMLMACALLFVLDIALRRFV